GGNMTHGSCLPGLCLSQRISTQKQALTRPSIWAEPDSRIPEGKPAAIWCQGPPRAEEYQLRSKGGLSAWGRPEQPGARGGVRFPIAAMTSRTAGRYRCFCRSGELWSEPSEPLDLVVTGMYDTPTLWVQPVPKVTSGENVIFYCQLETVTNTFFLLQEGWPSHTQGSHRAVPAEFPMGPVTSAHTGTYRCFGAYSGHVWSFPSEPVKLLVTGEEAPKKPPGLWGTMLHPISGPSAPAPAAWDHTAQNLLRIGLAVLVLVALMWLLAEDWLCRWRTREGAGRMPRPAWTGKSGLCCRVGVTCTDWGVGVEVTACRGRSAPGVCTCSATAAPPWSPLTKRTALSSIARLRLRLHAHSQMQFRFP
uniref:Natural cytotoxicity triggering receptor 1 n=1 Tax=Oryctolagus cuniculus TaxID=9986 RepID=A0A5F9CES0_RABIT